MYYLKLTPWKSLNGFRLDEPAYGSLTAGPWKNRDEAERAATAALATGNYAFVEIEQASP